MAHEVAPRRVAARHDSTPVATIGPHGKTLKTNRIVRNVDEIYQVPTFSWTLVVFMPVTTSIAPMPMSLEPGLQWPRLPFDAFISRFSTHLSAPAPRGLAIDGWCPLPDARQHAPATASLFKLSSRASQLWSNCPYHELEYDDKRPLPDHQNASRAGTSNS